MILDGVDAEEIYQSVVNVEATLLRESSFDVYDHGLNLCRNYKCSNDIPSSLFQFLSYFVKKVSAKELYLIIVEKLSWLQYQSENEEISEGFFVYVIHSLHLYYVISKQDSRKNDIEGGLSLLLSTVALLLELQTRGDSHSPSFDVIDVTLDFCRSLASQSKEWCHPSTLPVEIGAWEVKDADSIAAFVLNIVAHFVVATKVEARRTRYMDNTLKIMRSLRVDVVRVVTQPRRLRAFLYESKQCEALAFDFMNSSKGNGSPDENKCESKVGADDVAKHVERIPLGLCGSGLDDGTPMTHLTGLERVVLAYHSNEQREALLRYAQVCFGQILDSNNSQDVVDSQKMGVVELVPWKAVSDKAVRTAVERLNQYDAVRDITTCPIDTKLERLFLEIKTQRLPGTGDTEAACWPLLGCAMVGFFWLRDEHFFPCGVYTPSYIHSIFEPLLYPLLQHPCTSTCEALLLSIHLGSITPSPSPGSPPSRESLFGYTFTSSAALIDTSGYQNLEQEKQRVMGHKREFGVNAVVSHVAARLKGPPSYSQDMFRLGLLCAASTDAFFIVQALISGIVHSPIETRTQDAFAALQKRLSLFDDKGLYLLLRKLVQDCPFPNVSGLLIDVVKSCSQSTSRGMHWQASTILRSRNSNCNGLRDTLSLQGQGSLVAKRNSISFIVMAQKRECGTNDDKNAKQDHLGQVTEEALVLSLQNSSPFWSPLVVLSYSWTGLEAITQYSSSRLERELDIVAAAILLLLHCKQRLHAAVQHRDFACLYAFLNPLEPNPQDRSLEPLKKDLDQILAPLHKLAGKGLERLERLSVTIRCEENSGRNAGRHKLRLQLLQMNLRAILDLSI